MVVRVFLSTITLLLLSSLCWSIFFLARLLCLILTRMRMLRTAVRRRGRKDLSQRYPGFAHNK